MIDWLQLGQARVGREGGGVLLAQLFVASSAPTGASGDV